MGDLRVSLRYTLRDGSGSRCDTGGGIVPRIPTSVSSTLRMSFLHSAGTTDCRLFLSLLLLLPFFVFSRPPSYGRGSAGRIGKGSKECRCEVLRGHVEHEHGRASRRRPLYRRKLPFRLVSGTLVSLKENVFSSLKPAGVHVPPGCCYSDVKISYSDSSGELTDMITEEDLGTAVDDPTIFLRALLSVSSFLIALFLAKCSASTNGRIANSAAVSPTHKEKKKDAVIVIDEPSPSKQKQLGAEPVGSPQAKKSKTKPSTPTDCIRCMRYVAWR